MARRRSQPTWEEFAKEFGVRLHQARMAKGLSQERLAHLAGISGYTYQKFEKGESRPGAPMNPRLRTLVALSQVLEVSLVDLIPPDLPDATAR